MTNKNVFMSRRNARGIFAPVRSAVSARELQRKIDTFPDLSKEICEAITDNTKGNAVVKRCSKCGKLKAIDKFYRDKSKKDGHKSACKACSK